MIPQQPFKWVCPQCGYSKTITPKSDVIRPEELMNRCPQCSATMEKRELSGIVDAIKSLFTK